MAQRNLFSTNIRMIKYHDDEVFFSPPVQYIYIYIKIFHFNGNNFN